LNSQERQRIIELDILIQIQIAMESRLLVPLANMKQHGRQQLRQELQTGKGLFLGQPILLLSSDGALNYDL